MWRNQTSSANGYRRSAYEPCIIVGEDQRELKSHEVVQKSRGTVYTRSEGMELVERSLSGSQRNVHRCKVIIHLS